MNLTQGQKHALYESLRDQRSPMTTAEKRMYSRLREDLADRVTPYGRCHTVLYLDGYCKEVDQDTFGDDYRFRWCKVHETGKGQYYYSNYYEKRVYLF
jgi:hypothetical protein